MESSQPPDLRANKAARMAVRNSLSPNKSAKQVSNSAIDLIKILDYCQGEAETLQPKKLPIACRSGCDYCCYMRVTITPFELIHMVQFIENNISNAQLEDLKLRVVKSDNITHGMNEEKRGQTRISCPLLVNKCCSVYDARPFECRGYVSTNVDACQKSYENYDAWDVPIDFSQYSLYKNAQAGLNNPEREFELLELTAALRIALDDPSAIERWLEGHNSFEAARIPPSDPEARAFLSWTPTFGVTDG